MDKSEENLRELLDEMYHKDSKSLRQIGKELDIPLSTLWNLFESLGVRTRTQARAIKMAWKKKRGKYNWKKKW